MRKIKLFLRFGIIGALVFLIEAAILFALTHELHLEPRLSRCISFAPAVMSAWFLNRTFTFRSKKKTRWYKELMRYIIVNLGGLSSNFATYLFLLYWFEEARAYPVLALAGGSVAGMFLNFIASKRLVFTR